MIRLSKMPSQFVIWLIITGISYVYGNQCDSETTKSCYEDLVYYETLIFPLYGHNKAQLDNNCGNIKMSMDCIRSYSERCKNSDMCDKKCDKLVTKITNFLRATGIIRLSEILCNEESVLRQTYLENVDCLEENGDRYAGCHNMSQLSQHYMHIQGARSVENSCCYISWYKDCFTNATRDYCETNATVFVSYAVESLLGDISNSLCKESKICATPPLPPEGFTIDYEMDKDKSDDEPDEDKSGGEDLDKDKSGEEDLDKDKPDETDNEIDNAIDESGSKASTIKSYTAILIVLPYIFTTLSKYFL